MVAVVFTLYSILTYSTLDSYILRQVASHLRKPISQTTLIVLHLGSGASVCAIKNGKSLDTSMGLTPLDGLPGATRSGSVDPSMIFHYRAEAEGGEEIGRISRKAAGEVHITDVSLSFVRLLCRGEALNDACPFHRQAEEILNKHSGWKSLTGTTDFRAITSTIFPNRNSNSNSSPSYYPSYYPASSPSHPYHALAFNILIDRILTYVGSYFLKLGGAFAVDAIVFSGGIGERSVELRAAVGERCACLGVVVDREKNEAVNGAKESVVEIGDGSGSGSVKALVCKTDEQVGVQLSNNLVLRAEVDECLIYFSWRWLDSLYWPTIPHRRSDVMQTKQRLRKNIRCSASCMIE